jgi:hypothetical protein
MAGIDIDISKKASNAPWSGLDSKELKAAYKQVYALGTLSKAHYVVELSPVNPSPISAGGVLGSVLALQPDGLGWALPWLATSVNFGLLDAQNDSVQIGAHQQNYITGNSSSEVQVTFLETANGDIIRMVQAIKRAMFKRDGTQGLPYDYLLNMRIYLFDRNNKKTKPADFNWIVALTSSSLDLSGSDRDPLQLQLGFQKMYPMMLGNAGDW